MASAAVTFYQDNGYLPSRTAPTPFGQYQNNTAWVKEAHVSEQHESRLASDL